MWERFKRLVRSVFGSILGSAENPERLLEQNLRDMNDQVPRMNAHVALVRANLTLMQREVERYEREISDTRDKIRVALSQGREDLGMEFAVQVESLEGHLASSRLQVQTATQAYEKAQEVKRAFLREKERKTRESMEAMRSARQAEWQSRIAAAMETFDVAGLDATHQEMIRRLERQAAVDSARLDLALEKTDTSRAEVEAEAERLRARALLDRVKAEMGLGPAADSGAAALRAPAEKTIGGTGGKDSRTATRKSKAEKARGA